MALALNNLKRVDMPLNKETKPNQTIKRKYEMINDIQSKGGKLNENVIPRGTRHRERYNCTNVLAFACEKKV